MRMSNMATRDEFESNSRLEEYLSEQLVKGRLALVLGAGISMPFGLPNWSQLIERLYTHEELSPPGGHDLTKAASFFLNKRYRDNYAGFLEAVKRALYDGVIADFQSLRENNTLGAIGSLVMASQRGSASTVITFNFDDLLERYLKYHGFLVISSGIERHWGGTSDVTVLHPHGILPFEGSIPFHELIFDRISYSKAIDPAKPWRQEILSIMRTHTCIFVGLSDNDNNLYSMLVACKDSHASREENSLFWGVTLNTDDDEVLASSWNEVGVFYRRISDYEFTLPDILFRVCQKAALIRASL